MPRRVRNTHLETRSARAKLTARRNPYWTRLAEGLHLGYVPRRGGGKWVARFYLGNVQWHYRGRASVRHYEKKIIGEADDYADANGVTVLNFDQAQAKARDLATRRGYAEGGLPVGPYTVARAIDDYVAYMRASGRSTVNDVATRAKAFIIPTLGHVEVADLTSERLRQFLAHLAQEPARVRTKKGHPQAHRPTVDERPRRASANRNFAILRAALNHAYDERKVASNDAWGRRVKPFRGVDGKRDRILSIEEAQRLINACEPRLRDLVQAALMTGCRFGELTRLTASDFKNGTVHVRRSKTGRERYVHLTAEGVDLFTHLCVGRAGDYALFVWTKEAQRKAFVAVLARATITPPITFHGLRHTYASLAVMNGVPLMVVAANLGHADTRMVERHYGHLARSYVAEAIRTGAPTFGTVTTTNVRRMT
jgi:integrase